MFQHSVDPDTFHRWLAAALDPSWLRRTASAARQRDEHPFTERRARAGNSVRRLR